MDQDAADRTACNDSPGASVWRSVNAAEDVALNCDPDSIFWRGTHGVELQFDAHGRRYHQDSTEARSRWTEAHLYLLFICPYKELYLNPHPVRDRKTPKLWDWDVAELLLGCDFENINRYKEFEVSPQGEWVELDVNLDLPDHTVGWEWRSGFEVEARIDQEDRVWFGAMRIPFADLDSQRAAAGRIFRVNLCRSEGPEQGRQLMAWKAPMKETFHVPERFGYLELVNS
jgi:hypothetical protein